MLHSGKTPASGFSLIELMIAVGIVAILTSASIPLYERYQSRSRQSEAKAALAAVYSAEKSFQSEYAAYASSFDAVHYVPEGLRRFYTVGWSAPMTATVTGYSGSLGNPFYTKLAVPSTFGCDVPEATPLLPATVGASANAFTAGAAGEIRSGIGCDVWTIDDEKIISNTIIRN